MEHNGGTCMKNNTDLISMEHFYAQADLISFDFLLLPHSQIFNYVL